MYILICNNTNNNNTYLLCCRLYVYIYVKYQVTINFITNKPIDYKQRGANQ